MFQNFLLKTTTCLLKVNFFSILWKMNGDIFHLKKMSWLYCVNQNILWKFMDIYFFLFSFSFLVFHILVICSSMISIKKYNQVYICYFLFFMNFINGATEFNFHYNEIIKIIVKSQSIQLNFNFFVLTYMAHLFEFSICHLFMK